MNSKPLTNTGRTSPNSSTNAWDKQIQLPKRDPEPKKPETYKITETRHLPQQREFTVGSNKQRSLSVSKREEQRTITVNKETNKAVHTTNWSYKQDVERQHKHPGGSWHTPTATPGFTGGTKSTPTERAKLDAAPSTKVKTRRI